MHAFLITLCLISTVNRLVARQLWKENSRCDGYYTEEELDFTTKEMRCKDPTAIDYVKVDRWCSHNEHSCSNKEMGKYKLPYIKSLEWHDIDVAALEEMW